MQTKQIVAVCVVVIVCAVAVGYLVMNNDGGDGRYVSTDDSGRLMVYGNANNDDYINEDDLETLRSIISGEEEETKYADANQDGVVNNDDIQFVQDIIDKKVDKVYVNQIHGGEEEVVDCAYPLERVCVAGYETMTVIKSIGAADKIICLSGASGDSLNERFYSDIYNLPKIGPDVWNVDIEQLSNYPVQAVVAMDGNSYIKNQDMIKAAEIDVIRIQAANGLTSL